MMAELVADPQDILEQNEIVKPFPGEVLVVGTGSLVGSSFVEQLGPQSRIYGADRKNNPYAHSGYLRGYQEIDIKNGNKMREVFERTPGKYVIIFAAYTNVGQAEKDRPENPDNLEELMQNEAYLVNVQGTKNVIEAAKATGKFPIFVSTDFVFDGKAGPYTEDDKTAENPEDLSWYGWTKKLAEDEITSSGIDFLMLRIAYPYRRGFAGKGDFGRDMLNKAATKHKDGTITFNYSLFDDQELTPTYIEDLAPAVVALVKNNCRGIYNLTSPQVVTPFDFGCEVYRVAWEVENPEDQIKKGKLADALLKPGATKKPLHGGLKVDKIIRDTGFVPTDWKTGIKKAYRNFMLTTA